MTALASSGSALAGAAHRVLLVDDNPAIHQDFNKILCPAKTTDTRTDDIETLLFGAPAEKTPLISFQLDSAYQGQEALSMLIESLAANRPYALAFVDVRMPPGWDGVETVNRLWEKYPGLQVVICTAYSDYSWEAVRATLKYPDSLAVLKKPFDNAEVQQLAQTLVRKWELNAQAVMGIRQLDHNIRRLLATSPSDKETSPGAEEDLPPDMLTSCDGMQFANALARLSEAVDTTRRQLLLAEQKLVQSEEMAALGRLSAGIVHEINHPLDAAMAALSLLERGSKQLPDALRAEHMNALKDLRDGLSRVADITGSLRKFTHPEGSVPLNSGSTTV